MTMTDEELDRDWQPNGRRPQSTIARSFSAELMDIFRIENSLTDLDAQVHDKPSTRTLRNSPLSKPASAKWKSASVAQRQAPREPPSPRLQAAKGTDQESQQQQPQSDSLDASSKDDAKARSRPGTARAAQQAPSSGNMPPTPGASEGEYYVVTHADLRDGPR
ncbi:hypothetical protein NM208_g11939 [Fusarium decemcellulare]|uniref:Uncharacterized protein n=1 Tax=Fusarium decemcellulare TaxID=57161 RepID=A0ACC1RR00_9HYPO|nr:hypothetical protein NM208_g11939 [Fusarium decemcellulare]